MTSSYSIRLPPDSSSRVPSPSSLDSTPEPPPTATPKTAIVASRALPGLMPDLGQGRGPAGGPEPPGTRPEPPPTGAPEEGRVPPSGYRVVRSKMDGGPRPW